MNANVGSGKTTVLISKILYLHVEKEVPYENMIVLTFTNKAAGEIRERLSKLEVGMHPNQQDDSDKLPNFGTFHSVALYLLRECLPLSEIGFSTDFQVIEPEEELELALTLIRREKLNIKYKNRLKKRLETEKNNRYQDDLDRLRSFLTKEKQKQEKMTFQDLLTNAILLLEKYPLYPKWIIIDEVQDTDALQLQFIQALTGRETCLFAVGDPNQVIYSFRGGNVNALYQLKALYQAKELSLTVNYRSNEAILQVAKRFLQNTTILEGTKEAGSKILVRKQYDAFQDALYLAEKIKKLHDRGVAYGEIAVFYRLQSQAVVFEKVFDKNEIPYRVSFKQTVSDIPVLNWILKVLRASVYPKDAASLDYALNEKHYCGKAEKRKLLAEKIVAFRKDAVLDLYEYFALDHFLQPTASSYQTDKACVEQLFCKIIEAPVTLQDGILAGLEQFLSSSALYGTNFLKEESGEKTDTVKLMTLHASKGLEFSHVFITGVNNGLIPLMGKSFEEEEEERRLFFVGITRAKECLELSYYTNPDAVRIFPGKSRFLQMIPSELIEEQGAESDAPALSLQELRRQVEVQREQSATVNASERKESFENILTTVRYATHPKYGKGMITAEDDVMITVQFEGYGEKEFVKAFSELDL